MLFPSKIFEPMLRQPQRTSCQRRARDAQRKRSCKGQKAKQFPSASKGHRFIPGRAPQDAQGRKKILTPPCQVRTKLRQKATWRLPGGVDRFLFLQGSKSHMFCISRYTAMVGSAYANSKLYQSLYIIHIYIYRNI